MSKLIDGGGVNYMYPLHVKDFKIKYRKRDERSGESLWDFLVCVYL